MAGSTPKEQAFMSAVVYLGAGTGGAGGAAVAALDRELAARFERYEIVLAHDGPAAGFRAPGGLACPSVSAVHMGRPQGLEAAMNAGVDCAVGDYVLEVDDLAAFEPGFVGEAYALAMEGADIVFGAAASRSARGALFYPLFNRFSGAQHELTTTACSLVSRRAVNRVRSMAAFMPYRKAAYASCGLEAATVRLSGRASGRADLGLAVDSLALYSDAFYRVAFGIAAAMALVSLAEIAYVVAIYLQGIPIGGWTSTMLMMTLGFLGVFVALAFVLKYVSLLLKSQFNRQPYLIEGVERL